MPLVSDGMATKDRNSSAYGTESVTSSLIRAYGLRNKAARP
jgi:hypothetical protein